MINLIAEIGLNHIADMEIIERLIKVSALAGFNYVKFQKRNPEKSTPKSMRDVIRDTPWGRMSYIDYRKKIELSEDQYIEIDKICKREGIKWFASVWDLDSAIFFAKRNKTDIIKIPSAKITDKKLLTYCRANFDKVIISTGMSNEKEIEKAVKYGEPDIIFHSVASYPTEPEDIHLEYITNLQNKYPDKEIGYSGHELGIDLALLSIPFNIKWIEKHITLDRNMWGSDQKISIEPKELFELSEKVKKAEKCFSNMNTNRKVLDCEKEKRSQLR